MAFINNLSTIIVPNKTILNKTKLGYTRADCEFLVFLYTTMYIVYIPHGTLFSWYDEY